MIRIAICDDNQIQLEIIEDILADFRRQCKFPVEICAYKLGSELIQAIKSEGKFDIYILDMLMPEMNGMEVASTLRMMKDDGKIIFLTATLDYAVASYDVKAYYYMLKPVDKEKLYRILGNAVDELIEQESNLMVLKTPSGDKSIPKDEIMYIALENRAMHYYLSDGRAITSMTLRVPFRDAVTDFLKYENFTLCGVSMAINMRFIDGMDNESVTLKDGTVIYPSKAGCTALRKIWKEYHNS